MFAYHFNSLSSSANFLIFETIQVLVTVPLTLLQKNMIQFNPPLPERKLKAIHSLGAGIIEKVTWPPPPRTHKKKRIIIDRQAQPFIYFDRLQFSFHSDSGTKKLKGLTTLVTYRQALTKGACSASSMTWTHRFAYFHLCFCIHRFDLL